jgi:uncharacterized membrane protein
MQKLKALFAASATFMTAALFSSAHAAIAALDVAPIQTDVETTVSNITPAVLSILAVVMGVVIGVKLVKKLIGAGS